MVGEDGFESCFVEGKVGFAETEVVTESRLRRGACREDERWREGAGWGVQAWVVGYADCGCSGVAERVVLRVRVE